MLRKSKNKTKNSPIAQQLSRAGAGLQIALPDLVIKTGGNNIYDALLCVQRGVCDFYAENQLLCKIVSCPLREVFKLG